MLQSTIQDLLKHIPESKQIAFLREFAYLVPRFSKTVEVELIKRRAEHLRSVGYAKKQIVLSIMNEFNKSERTCYRYLS